MTEPEGESERAASAWAASGMTALTGRPGADPVGPPGLLVPAVEGWARRIADRTGRIGQRVVIDPLALMTERAACTGHTRHGAVSCGGGCHLIRADDGWVAVSLARPDDWVLMGALLERSAPFAEGDWDGVEAGVADRGIGQLRERATLLGLALAVLGERTADRPTPGSDGSGVTGPRARPDRTQGPAHGIRGRRVGDSPPALAMDGLVVADLSSLWAGPLVGRLLRRAGADVVKVESTGRPDGARRGPPPFFDLLNGGKASVALDLTGTEGRRRLHRLVDRADVVVTSSRPRALEQLGLDAPTMTAGGGPQVWLMISGYGGAPVDRDRVAFGDDAAVAGGLVVRDGEGPSFCGDAVADPLCGLAGTDAVLAALETGGRWILEASMADIAAGVSGPSPQVTHGSHQVSPVPVAVTRAAGTAAPLGADTDRVLARLGVA